MAHYPCAIRVTYRLMRAMAVLLVMLLSALGLLILAARLYKYAQERKPQPPVASVFTPWSGPDARQYIDSLRTGDVALRMGRGTFSRMLAAFNQRDKSYSHCGLVVVEHGYPFIYHCEGAEGDNHPCIRRDSASWFFAPSANVAAAAVRYSMADSIKDSMPLLIQRWRTRRPVFDALFDLNTDNELYCTEFVYKVITRLMADSTYLPLSTLNARRFAGTDDLYLNPHAAFIWQVRF